MSAAPEGRPPAGRTWTLVAAGALVVVVVVLVVVLGIERPPTLGSVADEPGAVATGRVAWTDTGSSSGERCLRLVGPSGDVRSLRCGDSLVDGDAIGWSDGSIVVDDPGAEVEHLVDPASGDSATRPAPAHRRPATDDASELRTERTGGELRVVVDGRTVWSTPAVAGYDVRRAAVSGDGETVLLRDDADRLLVVPADGSAPPLVWATDVPGWGPIAWEAATPG